MIRHGIFALPSFADGGPFPGVRGGFTDAAGEAVMPDSCDRVALAALYIALMTDIALDLIRSDGVIVFDGGLARIRLFPRLVAALRPRQRVLVGSDAEGTASAAAGIAFDRLAHDPFRHQSCEAVSGFDPAGWRDYATQCKGLSANRQPASVEPKAAWARAMPQRRPRAGDRVQDVVADRA